MFVQMQINTLTKKEHQEFYDVVVALCQREQVQLEEKNDVVSIHACPQGVITIEEKEGAISCSSSTRHGGPGYHAFVVDFFLDIQTELGKQFELYDDLNYDQDGNFDRLVQIYEDEITYLKGLLLNSEDMLRVNTIYDETLFYPMVKEGKVPTILGYLDKETLKRMSEKDLMPYFYIWNDWDKDAQYYRQVALYRYVKEGLKEYTNINELSIKYAHEICDMLELAHSLDPYIPLPMDIYQELLSYVDRKPILTECVSMDQEIKPYRMSDVYHLYDDLQIVAHGASLRSVDKVSQSLCIMAPYTQEEHWHWLIQASHNPNICEYLENEDSKQIQQDDHLIIEAKKEKEGKPIYFHCVIADEKDLDYIQFCIKNSQWMPSVGS